MPPRTTLSLKVVPGASRTEIVGWLGAALKVRVAAPPEGGRANASVEALMAGALGVDGRSVRIVAGHGSERKSLEIVGLDETDARRRLEDHLAGKG